MKKSDMKKICLAASLVLFAACGDDVTNDSVIKAESYDSKADLPECDDASSGLFATVPSKKEVYFCTDNAWKNIRSEAASLVDNGKFICSTEELSDNSGFKVVCGGDSVGVVLNGKKGDKGSDAGDGSVGLKGEPGKSGSGSNGKDLTLGENDCAVMNSGFDYVIYDCGDSVYVKSFTAADKANLKTWNALSGDQYLKNVGNSNIATIYTKHLTVSGQSEGKIERWEGDKSWTNGDAISAQELFKNFAIAGKATLEVKKGATTYSSTQPLEPMIYAMFLMSPIQDANTWGGFCLTYEAQKDMELIIRDASTPQKIARAALKASSKETTVDVLFSAFQPDDENVELDEIIHNLAVAYIKIVGSLDEGKYENKYAIYEFGAYGKCDGTTISQVKAKLKEINPKKGTVKDPRDKKTYNTVTIGDRTWFTENLDYDYKVLVDPDDESAGYVSGLVAEYPNQADKDLYGGKLYSWLAAIDYDSLAKADPKIKCSNTNYCDPPLSLPEKVQGICPEGWRLPTEDDFDTLLNILVDYDRFPKLARLAILDSTGFTGNNGGLNLLGTSFRGSGYFDGTTSTGLGTRFYSWIPAEYDAENARVYYVYAGANSFTFGTKTRYRVVRCVKDNGED